MMKMTKFETQQHVMQNVCSQKTKQNPDYSKHKYYRHLEHVSFLVHEYQTHAFLYYLHYQLKHETPYFLNSLHQIYLVDTTVHSNPFILSWYLS